MEHPIFKVKEVRAVADYILELTFNDGLKKRINLEPVLFGEIFSPLRDLELFRQVKIDPEIETIVWPNGADFEPAILHDWEKYIDELKDRAKYWETIKT